MIGISSHISFHLLCVSWCSFIGCFFLLIRNQFLLNEFYQTLKDLKDSKSDPNALRTTKTNWISIVSKKNYYLSTNERKKYDRNVKFEWKRKCLRSSAFKHFSNNFSFYCCLNWSGKKRNRKTYCRSLRCWRFFLNAFFTRNIKNAARSMESDVPFSAFSFLSPFSYVFFVVPSFIVWPSGPRTHAPSEFTVFLFLFLALHLIIFYWLLI